METKHLGHAEMLPILPKEAVKTKPCLLEQAVTINTLH